MVFRDLQTPGGDYHSLWFLLHLHNAGGSIESSVDEA
jgi:hypothetical protein